MVARRILVPPVRVRILPRQRHQLPLLDIKNWELILYPRPFISSSAATFAAERPSAAR